MKKSEIDEQFSCIACHEACSGGCTGSGPANCTDCRRGYERDPETNSCVDINECELGPDNEIEMGAKRLCSDGTYCVNTNGHYKCADCHRACASCLSYGADKCLTCASDHYMDEEHNCVYSPNSEGYYPFMKEGESVWSFVGRRLRSDMLMTIIINMMLYPIVRWLVDKFNLGNQMLKEILTLFVTASIGVELYPYVYKVIATNFGRRESQGGAIDEEAQPTRAEL